MKSFKNIFSEVAQPKSSDEKKFKDAHQVDVIDPEGHGPDVKPKTNKRKRFADYATGADERAYDLGRSKDAVKTVSEKADSIAQQQLMGMAYALKIGEMDPEDASDEVKELAKSMSEKDLRDFAKTKHKGLPDKVEESIKQFIENPNEEIPMMKSQLAFIMYAAEEIMEYLDMGIDPEEWYQNKLAYTHGQMKTLYSYAQGEMQMMSVNYEFDDQYTVYESQIDENFKKGNLKLKNGTIVRLDRSDAEALNKMFKTMDSRNKKQMEKELMTDQDSFESILKFAKEAL